MTDKHKELIQQLVTNVEALGYKVKFEGDTPEKKQRVVVGKNGKVIAKVSIILAARVDTMFNGVGRDEIELLKVLTLFSTKL
ncbi:hypothetical protein [Lacticaseibacillus suilingensis]|uniref:hypothetical protein n=1 Tax=Lacticaseibacillus suilingensis TaxID=2799577 RepID=UPI0022E06D34|nr:hypothetical protein [Lacticaseibacillus suilingensis]